MSFVADEMGAASALNCKNSSPHDQLDIQHQIASSNISEYRNPLLSIVIPTRNRAKYAISCLRSLLSVPDRDIEIVMQDNSDDYELADFIRKAEIDPRLSYKVMEQKVDMIANWENGLSRATGEYVCIIGDDDSVNPEIIDAVRWMKLSNIECLIPVNAANYVWPDLNMDQRAIFRPGDLRVAKFTGKITYHNPEDELLKCLYSSGQEFHELPKLYYGIVRRNILQQMKLSCGTCFPGVSPDMAVAVGLSGFVTEVCRLDYPLFLPGSSYNSAAGASGLGKHLGWLKDQPHLADYTEERWSSIIPAFYSVQTVWAETVIEALIASGRDDLTIQFNFQKLYAHLIIFYPEFYKKIFTGLNSVLNLMDGRKVKFIITLTVELLFLLTRRAKAFINRFKVRKDKTSFCYSKSGVNDINQAVIELSRYLQMNTLSIGQSCEVSGGANTPPS